MSCQLVMPFDPHHVSLRLSGELGPVDRTLLRSRVDDVLVLECRVLHVDASRFTRASAEVVHELVGAKTLLEMHDTAMRVPASSMALRKTAQAAKATAGFSETSTDHEAWSSTRPPLPRLVPPPRDGAGHRAAADDAMSTSVAGRRSGTTTWRAKSAHGAP